MLEDAVRLPLLEEILPGGLRYGSSYLVEFEPQSLWYEASLTLCAQALRIGIRADYHVFTHLPGDIRVHLGRLGLDVEKLESDDTFRIIDSYSVQTGTGAAKQAGRTSALESVGLKSMSMDDWNFVTSSLLKSEAPDVDKRRLHIDDDTSVLVQFNDEKRVAEHFRTHTVPYVKHLQLAALHSVARGVFSESFYSQFETFSDGIIDFRSQEAGGQLAHSMRMRVARGAGHYSGWKAMEISPSAEVRLANPQRPLGTSGEDAERRLAAIMFTDTVGFTGLGQKDEELMMQLLAEQRKILRSAFARYRGREVKTTGDGFLVEFPSSLEAVKCALEIQASLKEENRDRAEERKIIIRIGIHMGDVIHSGSDVAGDAVNVASRIEPLAAPGGVTVSGQVYESVVSKVDCSFDSMGAPPLKNVDARVEVYQVAGLVTKTSALGKGSAPTHGRIAVLPLVNISTDRGDDYFADGMTEELISSVSRVKGLHVIARTSVMRFKGKDTPVWQIGKELGVGSILEGSVRKSGDRVRISVQLVDTKSEEPRWSQVYDRELQDIFAVQSDISQKVAGALRVTVLGEAAGESQPTSSSEAYVNYLRGRQAWNRRTEEGLRQAIEFFQKALALDSRYANAYAGLADSHSMLALLEFVAPREAYPKAKAAVEMALSIDPGLAEAHTSLGLIKFQYDWDWKGAEDEFKNAIGIKPSYAPAHHYLADYLKAMGRFDEALSEIAKALELDPLNLAINTGVGHVLYLSRQYDRAIDQYRKAVDLDPNFMQTHIWFGRPYLEKGMYDEAISELETAVRLSGEGTLALAMLGHGLASAGKKAAAQEILDRLAERSKTRYVPSYWIAVIYNGLRDKENAMLWLGKAFEERSSWLVWCNVEPRFDWMRSEPGFISLVRSMRFP